MSDLVYTGLDGIPIKPLYTEPVRIEVPKRSGPWQIRPMVTSADEARQAVELGADSLWWYGEADAPGDLGRPVVDSRTPVADSIAAHLDGATDLGELASLYRYARLADTGTNEVRLYIGRDVFKGIAKLRAVRILWRECRGRNPFVHAVGSLRSLTRYDAQTNILRQTTQAFAAAVGGADAITLWPYDAPGGANSDRALRLAVTTQMVLREEAMIDTIADPAQGAYYIDWLTREMVERAKRMTDAEYVEQLRAEVGGAGPIVGVTDYPLDGDEPLPRVVLGDLGDLEVSYSEAHAFEALRDNPAGPVYLCKLGTLREHRADAAFARSLLITGGFDVVEGDGPDGFADSGASIACVVGPGDVEIPGAARVLRNLDPKLDKLAFLTELRT